MSNIPENTLRDGSRIEGLASYREGASTERCPGFHRKNLQKVHGKRLEENNSDHQPLFLASEVMDDVYYILFFREAFPDPSDEIRSHWYELPGRRTARGTGNLFILFRADVISV